MSSKNRIGTFCMFCGALALLLFWASLQAPDKHYDLVALLAGAALMAVGWVMRTSKQPVPPSRPAEPPARPKRPGLLSQLGRKPPPPPPPPPPPAPPQKAGLALFKSKPGKAAPGGRPAAGPRQNPGGSKSR